MYLNPLRLEIFKVRPEVPGGLYAHVLWGVLPRRLQEAVCLTLGKASLGAQHVTDLVPEIIFYKFDYL
jgi:hypothetical protein